VTQVASQTATTVATSGEYLSHTHRCLSQSFSQQLDWTVHWRRQLWGTGARAPPSTSS